MMVFLNEKLVLVLVLVVLSALSSVSVAADISDGAVASEPHDQWSAAAAEILMERADADSLYTAALIGAYGSASDSLEAHLQALQGSLDLLDRAAAQDPNAGEIAAQALLVCSKVGGCDLESYAERFQLAAPGNALAWLPLLKPAIERQDEARVTGLLKRMADAKGYSGYWIESGQRIARALEHVPPPGSVLPDSATDGAELTVENTKGLRESYALAMASGSYSPGYQALMAACSPDGPAFDDRRAACRSIALKMENSGALLDNMVGLALLRRSANDDEDRTAAIESKRRLDWQVQNHSRLQAGMLGTEKTSANKLAENEARKRQGLAVLPLVEALREHGSELGAIQALLTRAGVPLDPPDDWRMESFAESRNGN